jgi:hypothetical protein
VQCPGGLPDGDAGASLDAAVVASGGTCSINTSRSSVRGHSIRGVGGNVGSTGLCVGPRPGEG